MSATDWTAGNGYTTTTSGISSNLTAAADAADNGDAVVCCWQAAYMNLYSSAVHFRQVKNRFCLQTRVRYTIAKKADPDQCLLELE